MRSARLCKGDDDDNNFGVKDDQEEHNDIVDVLGRVNGVTLQAGSAAIDAITAEYSDVMKSSLGDLSATHLEL
jgi:hypothetical protein